MIVNISQEAPLMHHARAGLAVVPASLVLALASSLAATASPATAIGHTKVLGNCVKATYRPQRIILACADANADLSHITYSTWTRHSATGMATLDRNTCKPSCVAGHEVHSKVLFRLHAVKTEKGTKVFTAATTQTGNASTRTWSLGL
jgi:hypothetical protein